jgi:serine protease inhibitor
MHYNSSSKSRLASAQPYYRSSFCEATMFVPIRISSIRGSATGALLAAFALTGGCGGNSGGNSSGNTPNGTPPAVAQAKAADASVNPAIVAADNAFGLNLLDTLISVNSGNVAISPVSVALALQVVYNGAAGTTQQAMAQTLQLGALSTQELNSANAALQASLIDADPQVQITLANSLWMHLNDNPVSPALTATDQQYYGAKVGDLSGAPSNVNAWVASETNGLITQILPPETAGYYADITAIVANVIYFKGEWSTGFDSNQTASASFTLTNGDHVPVVLMHQSSSYGYLQGDHFQVVRLPYGQGRLSMLIVLPDSTLGLNSLVAGITAVGLNDWIAQLQMSTGDIALPRFTATFGASLPSALTSLGMGIAFCPNQADLSGIAPLQCLTDAEHKVVVEVDENGTVAAGVTTVGVGTSVVQAPQFTMTMDHPFFYAIRDDKTGELLFVGTLQDPS